MSVKLPRCSYFLCLCSEVYRHKDLQIKALPHFIDTIYYPKMLGPEPFLCFLPQVPDTRVRWFGTYHWQLRLSQKVQHSFCSKKYRNRLKQPFFLCLFFSPLSLFHCLSVSHTQRHSRVCFVFVTLSFICSLSGCPRARKSGIKIIHSKENKEDQEPIRYSTDTDHQSSVSLLSHHLAQAELLTLHIKHDIGHAIHQGMC